MEELLTWLTSNGGHLHPSSRLLKTPEKGCHLEAAEGLPSGTLIVHVPHSLVMSCLNAMVDDSLPVLKANADSFKVEALGVFYLMSQWLQRDTSFWKPYLNILNDPETGFNTPFWFDERDLLWLEGTDLLTSFEARQETWKGYWRDGTAILAAEGMDCFHGRLRDFKHLCKWATTVYTSRSLSSRAVRPHDNKYWTAYKQGPSGRQTVLLDFSRVPDERKDFPVLIPAMDCLNHHHEAHVDWTFEPGRFVLTLGGDVSRGHEVLNNYGPKTNSELLMGYGFCVENNPFDGVFEALKPPPAELQPALRRIHPGFFTTSGKWNSEAATFQLREWLPSSNTDIWNTIPPHLLELFYYLVLHERGLPITPIPSSDPSTFLLQSSKGRKYLPRIAFLLFSSLLPKITKITSSDPQLPSEPENDKQRYAKVYRDGQRRILLSLREGLLGFQRSLRPSGPLEIRAYVLTLEEALAALRTDNSQGCEDFTTGIKSALGIDDLADVRGSDLEQHLWVLYLCFVHLLPRSAGLVAKQLEALEAEYGLPVDEEEEAEDPEGTSFLGIVERAVAHVGDDSAWRAGRWTSSFVLDWGLRIARSQGMQMRIAEGDVRYVVYLHVDS